MHLVAKEPNQHGGIKHCSWLTGSEALELLLLVGLGHLPGELLKHAAQRRYAGGLCGGEVIRPTVQRTIPNDSSHDSRHPVDRHQIFLLIPLHAECIQQRARPQRGIDKCLYKRLDDSQRLVEAVKRVGESRYQVADDDARAMHRTHVQK